MAPKRSVSQQTAIARPSLSTIQSDDGQGNKKQKSVKRAETAPVMPTTVASMKRKESAKPKLLNRPSTLSQKRPLARVPSVKTRYMEMLLHLDEIPRSYNILASLATWILLASFLVVPGTFTTFKESKAFQDADSGNSGVKHTIVNSINHIGLLWLSGTFCVVGIVGCLGLWYRWRENYLWLLNRIFLPVIMNSFAGLVSSLTNIYTAQSGVWSITAKITVIVIGSCMLVAGFLFSCYNFWALRRVRKVHERELGLEHQHEDETLVEKVKRKAHEPPLQPGSLV